MLIKNKELLNEQEYYYAMNPATHLDFLIYNRIGKKPMLAIEVDGYKHHKGIPPSKVALKKRKKSTKLLLPEALAP